MSAESGVNMDDSDHEEYNLQEKRRAGAKKKRYSQKYSKHYETDLHLKNWVKQSSKGDCYAYCSNVMFTLN